MSARPVAALPPEPTLESWVRPAVRGDVAASRRLFDGLLPVFLRVGVRLLGRHSSELDDFVQDAALRFFQGLPAYRGDSGLRWFAYRVATFTATDWIRNRTAAKRAAAHEDDVLVAVSASGPSDPARRRDHLDVVAALARSLNEDQLETLVLRAVFGFRIADIAEQMSVPVDTVRSRLRVAKQRIRREAERDPSLHGLLRGTSP
ncbi:MAG: sigma-70 family RNA polymerase sigma factor [Myxococcota bacterium]